MSASMDKLSQTIAMWTSVLWGMMPVVVTVFAVTLIWAHAALVHRDFTEETGTLLMEHDFHSLALAISMRFDLAKVLMLVIETRVLLRLEYIAATYQPMQFIMPVYEIQYMSDSISMEVSSGSNTNNFYCHSLGDIAVTKITTKLGMDSCISQLTLTCISTGGPATTVTWTRDSTTFTEGTAETELNDPVTAQYTHTLTV